MRRVWSLLGRVLPRARRSRRAPALWQGIASHGVVPIGIVGTCVLAGFANAGNTPSLPSVFGKLAECAGQSADPLLKAFEEGKKVVETIDKVADSLIANWEAITPLLSRLRDTAKIDMSLPALYQKFAVDVPERMSEFDDVIELLDKLPGDWKDVSERPGFLEDERTCRIALAAYGPIVLGPMGLLPLAKMPLPTDLKTDHYRRCIQEYTGIPEEDIIFVSRETQMKVNASSELQGRVSNFKPEFVLCPLFFVAIDHETRSVVLSVRGTLSLADVMTDCVADTAGFPAAGRGAEAHAGVVKAAELVRERAGAAVEAASAVSGYSRLLVTGHSLGGAVAHALAISLAAQPWFPSTSPDAPASNLPPSIRQVSAVAFGPPPYLSQPRVAAPTGTLGCASLQLPALRIPLLPPLGLPGIPTPGPLYSLVPHPLRRPVLRLRSFVHHLDLVPRLSLHGAERFAAFLAAESDDASPPHDPELFIPSEVVVVREVEGKMRWISLPGTDPLLGSRVLLALLLGSQMPKPMTDHLPDAYDKILQPLRPPR